MEKHALFLRFYCRMVDDARLSSSHISLYLALLVKWEEREGKEPFIIKRTEIMRLAKIASRQTYNKKLKELHAYQYLVYHPSNDPAVGSTVSMDLP